MPDPSVAIVIVNYNGRDHLGACLDSLAALDYPVDRFRVICVDNASSDGSVAWLQARAAGGRPGIEPELVLVEAGGNLGFAGGCNLGAERAKADYVAFVNNDARLDPGWLRAMLGGLAVAEPGVVCASAKMLDWEGETVDFVEGHLNFHGFARQAFWRAKVEPGLFESARPLLFACGGAMLIERRVFLEVGGFDEDYFMFFEDVDLGWRLWLLGYGVVFVPGALVYHRHHGSAGKLALARRRFLYERNALMTLIKNYDEANLARILPAALLLAMRRATDYLQQASGGPDDLEPERWHQLLETGDLERRISYAELAPIVALRELVQRMPALMEKRAAIQARRRRPDGAILPLFGQPLRGYPMAHRVIQAYCEDQAALIEAFGIDDTFRAVKTRVLILTEAGLPSLGWPASPEGERAEALGRALEAAGHAVRYALPRRLVEERALPGLVEQLAWDDRRVDDRILRYGPDAIVATHWRALAFARSSIYRPVVLDYNPLPPDLSGERPEARRIIERRDYLANVDLFTAGSAEELAQFGAWLAEVPGLSVPPERLALVERSVGAAAIAPLSAFCQAQRTRPGKLPVVARPEPPRTPLRRLPAKAAASLRRQGGTGLFVEIRQYLRWRLILLRRSLGG